MGHDKHGYCRNNHTYDHLVTRNIWLRETYKVQNTIASSFLIQKGDPCSNSSYVPISFSQRKEETRKNIKAGQRTESAMWGASRTGSTFSWFQEVLWWLMSQQPSCLLWDVAPHGGQRTMNMRRGRKVCFWDKELRSGGTSQPLGPHCCLQLATRSWSQGRSPHISSRKVRKDSAETGQKSVLPVPPPSPPGPNSSKQQRTGMVKTYLTFCCNVI